MPISFISSPASLESLARTELEVAYKYINTLNINVNSRLCYVQRGVEGSNINDDGLVTSFSMQSQEQISWLYAIGEENVTLFKAICELLESGIIRDLGVDEISIRNGEWTLSGRNGVWNDPEPRPQFVADFFNAIETVADSLEAPSYTDDQIIYGDQTYSVSTSLGLRNPSVLYRDDVIIGADGNDILIGLTGNDEITGKDGNDEIYGGFGSDALMGGAGDDHLYGQENADILYGGEGDDVLDGGVGRDWMSGGIGDDVYFVDNEEDIIRDNGNADDIDTVIIPVNIEYRMAKPVEDARLVGNHSGTLVGNKKDNNLTGNSGDNSISGSAGEDNLSGRTGDDVLNGGRGADTINGGAGDDTISGGQGDDLLSGGHGRDTFIFSTGGGKDRIGDFEPGTDTISIDRGAKDLKDLKLTELENGTQIEFRDVTIVLRDISTSEINRDLFEF